MHLTKGVAAELIIDSVEFIDSEFVQLDSRGFARRGVSLCVIISRRCGLLFLSTENLTDHHN
jgi:hypothetical protein